MVVAVQDARYARSRSVAGGPENRIERLVTNDPKVVEKAPEAVEEASEAL
jgi:hypothetical protein